METIEGVEATETAEVVEVVPLLRDGQYEAAVLETTVMASGYMVVAVIPVNVREPAYTVEVVVQFALVGPGRVLQNYCISFFGPAKNKKEDTYAVLLVFVTVVVMVEIVYSGPAYVLL